MKNPYRPQDFATEDEQNVEHLQMLAWDAGYAAGKEGRKAGDGGKLSHEETLLYQAELALTEIRTAINEGVLPISETSPLARELASLMVKLAERLES